MPPAPARPSPTCAPRRCCGTRSSSSRSSSAAASDDPAEGTVTRVTVDVPGRPYPVLVGQGALQELPRVVREMGATAAAVVSDRTVAERWAAAVLDGLTGAG